MRPIAPRLPYFEEITVAEGQHEYATITATKVMHPDNSHSMCCRWTFTAEERARIASGEDVYITFPWRVAPHTVSLRPDWANE